MPAWDAATAAEAILASTDAADGIDVTDLAYGPSTQKQVSEWIGGPLYYPFLAGFARWCEPRTIVEIGTHHGGSTLALSAGQPAGGRLITVDVTDYNTDALRTRGVIKLVGDAADESVLDTIAEAVGDRGIDLLFVDGAKTRVFALAVIEGLADRCGIGWLLLDDVRTRSTIADLWVHLSAAFGERAADVSAVAPHMRETGYGLGVVRFGPDGLKRLRGDRYASLPLHLPRPFDVNERFPGTPRMMRPREVALLHNIAADWLTGDGAVVDAGCFVGASTLALASAVAARDDHARFHKRIHVYDAFLNERGLYSSYLKGAVGAGQSWLGLFLETVAPYERYLNVYPGDFARKRWVGDPIELLFVDIAKSPALDAHIYLEFLPWLAPGRSVLIQQDFVHLEAPWIQSTLGQAVDHFEVLGVEPPSLVLGLRRPLPSRLVDRIKAQDFTPDEQIEGVLRLYEAIDHDEARGTLLATAAVLAARSGQRTRAHALLERRRAEHPAGDKFYLQRVGKAERIAGFDPGS